MKKSSFPFVAALFVFALGSLDTRITYGQPTNRSPQTTSSTRLLADFEQDRLTTLVDSAWITFNDGVMGGKSTMEAALSKPGAHASKGALALTSKITSDFQWGGFAGVRAAIHADESSENMSKFAGVQFFAKGDGKSYRLLVGRKSVKDGNHFYAEFAAPTEWALVKIPFTKLVQSTYFGSQVPWSPEDITAIGFLSRAEPGIEASCKLEIDDVAFFR